MDQKRWFLTACGCAILTFLGCNRDKSSHPADPSPGSTASAAASHPVSPLVPTTIPVGMRTLSVIQGEIATDYGFPPAQLHVNRSNREIYLYCKDAGTSASIRFDDNSYYLPLTVENFDDFLGHFDAGQLDAIELHLKSAPPEFDDENFEGITVDRKYRLQAVSGSVRLERSAGAVVVNLDAKFLKYDSQANTQNPAEVVVQGSLLTAIDSDVSAPPASSASQE